MKNSFNKRKFRYGSASVIFVAIVVAMVVVLNIFADFLTNRFSLKADMTEEGIYSLSDQTKQVLREMSADVKIYILASQAEIETDDDDDMKQMLETVRRFKSESGGKVDFEFIDTRKNPQFVMKYPKVQNAKVRDLVVEGPHRYIVLSSSNFTGKSENVQNKTYYRTEEDIAAAILYVTAKETIKAGFVMGHGEKDVVNLVNQYGEALAPDVLYEHFVGNNFEISEYVDLAKGVPEGITNLVIHGPTSDFAEIEIANLEKYINKTGNNLYIFWDSQIDEDCPRLRRFLREWGFDIGTEIVIDKTNSFSEEENVYADLLETDVIDKNLQGQSVIIAPYLCPIKLITPEGSDSGYKWTTAVAETRKTSEAGGENGPFTAVAVSMRSTNSGIEGDYSKIVLFGSEGIADAEIAANPRAFNNTLIARMVDFANPNTKTLQIMNKAEATHDLAVSKGEIRALSIILIGVIPLIFIALAVFIFIKRKNR